MSSYLGLALYAEGPTDYRFLSPLLYRLCEDICLDRGRSIVEISEVHGLSHPKELKDKPREERILAAARMARGAWCLLFIHADGDSDAEHALLHQIAPAQKLLKQHMGAEGLGIAVVPVRETESWLLADGDALRSVFGTALSDRQLGLPDLPRVECESDPKGVLSRCFDRARPGARRRNQRETEYFQSLGEEIALEKLRRLNSFQRLENELQQALREMRFIV